MITDWSTVVDAYHDLFIRSGPRDPKHGPKGQLAAGSGEGTTIVALTIGGTPAVKAVVIVRGPAVQNLERVSRISRRETPARAAGLKQ